MSIIRFVDLLVIKGVDQGMQYSVEENTYRVVGRTENSLHPSSSFIFQEECLLSSHQQELVSKQIKSYASLLPLYYQKRGPDILLADPMVNRAHGMVFMIDSKAGMIDLASTTGIRVNSIYTHNSSLYDGDLIEMGNTQMRVKIE